MVDDNDRYDFDPDSTEFDPKGDGNFALRNGRHLAWISDVDVVTTKAGDDMVVLEFSLHDPDDEDNGKRLAFQNYLLTPKALWKLASLCRVLKTGRFDPRNKGQLEEKLYGQPLAIVTQAKTSTWNGKTSRRSEVKRHENLTSEEEERLIAAYGEGLVPEEAPF